MLNFEFTEETQKALNDERFNHPHPRVRRKMSVLYLNPASSIVHGYFAHITT